ncbi:E3 ubiquitin-protein ligase LRSAM1 [Grifola frondosa]|uniref:E3 ubiquitin-protein ligase LRSAM1 n=1 Tax=Grifola frondosa TaxID=5627 RepID=A0A1C7LNN5_GRIFR|nr:E3 ubiquitin-protein ligase LRSAM1 [Grifola frondosa]
MSPFLLSLAEHTLSIVGITPDACPTQGARKDAHSTLTTQCKEPQGSPIPVPVKSPVRGAPPIPDIRPPTPQSPLSIREQIALKRAEAKKVTAKPDAHSALDFGGLEDALPSIKKTENEDNIDLGRWSVKESIERARSSGVINLASRALPCIPSALFEIHLGIKPEPLKSVPNEPPITTSTSEDLHSHRRGIRMLLRGMVKRNRRNPSGNFDVGSLKTVDLHNNKITTLPDSFADLTALTVLDLSHNELITLPANLFALPHLTTLNISHNALTTLPLRTPFAAADSNPLGRTTDPRGDWFSQSITRATTPLPRLTKLDASHNLLSAPGIDHSPGSLPMLLAKFDLSENPLGRCDSLICALARLERLSELRFERADVADDTLPIGIFSTLKTSSSVIFPALKLLHLGETFVTRPAIEATFAPTIIKQAVEFEVTAEEPPDGILRIVLGKKIIKEAWEVEAERRAQLKLRGARQVVEDGLVFGSRATPTRNGQAIAKEAIKEAWEIEVEQGLLTEGARRRARAEAAAAAQTASASASASSTARVNLAKNQEPQKEAWEIEAEQGLLTAGARRRARAAAALSAQASLKPETPSVPPPESTTTFPTPSTVSAALSNPQYYSSATQTLTLPKSTPPSKIAHARSFSLAASSWGKSASPATSELTLAIPTPSLPLAVIATQPFAQTLKILILANRRSDPSFSLPTISGTVLPALEELSLEGCSLADSVPVSHVSSSTDGANEFILPRPSEPLLPLIAKLFPSLRTLDLSYNAITSAALTEDALSSLILADAHDPDANVDAPVRKGLRHLRLRGNRLMELHGFQSIAEHFKGNRDVPEWKLEELDLRDNEIGKLPPELGLLPLDVFLVDGNIFRIPARRVWEREGTKGLLSWLRGRIE